MPRYRNKDGSPRASPRQKLATDLILSGKAKSLKDAAKKAGYPPATAGNATVAVFRTPGVKGYLKKLDDISKKRFGSSIQDKVMNVFFEALDATRLYGKDAIEHPDHAIRVQAADRFAKFFGWENYGVGDESKRFNQFNFFNVDPNKQKAFHDNLKRMIKKAYSW